MAQQSNRKESLSKPMSGMERLSLRVSSMINHPIAQQRRTVRIHRLDTDGEREWQEMLGALAEAGGVALKHHEQDASITLRWGPSADDERQTLVVDPLNSEEAAPF